MPSTPSSRSRVSVSYGAARVTVSSSSATVQRSITVIATSCWARTSSGLRGIVVASMAPSCIRFVTTAHLEQVASVLREDDALARRADLVPGTTDPLQPAGDARRALDLDDEVDGAHVDAELEAGRGDERREASGLEVLLDRQALLAGDAAVMGLDEVLAGELVQPLREPLGEPAAVGEDDRAALCSRISSRIRGWIAGQMLVRSSGLVAGPPGCSSSGQDLADRRHVVDRDDDLQLERLARAGVDDRDVAVRSDAAEEAGDRVERPLGGATGRSAACGVGVRGVGGARAVRGSGRGGRRASCPRSRGPRRR